MQPLALSVAIISFNEESNIVRTLESVAGLAGETIIVDSHSTDRTRELAAAMGAEVHTEDWKGHIAQKNSALEKCSQEWILALDADEVVSLELAQAIRTAVLSGSAAVGYSINRKTFYLGRFLDYAWQPDWKLRLVRRSAAPRWGGYNPHDVLEVQGATERLTGYLHHYSYKNLEDHFKRTVSYARLSAQSYHEMGRRFSWAGLLFNPLMAGFKKLVLKQSFRDGFRGMLVAGSTVLSVFLKYAFLWELEHAGAAKNSRAKTQDQNANTTL